MMIPSMWTESLYEYTPEQAIEIIGSCGYRCTEHGGTKHFDTIDQDADPLSRAGRIREVADRVGVAVDQMHGPFVNPLDEATRASCKEMIGRALEYASVLGVKWMVLHPATRAPDVPSSLTLDDVLAINVEFFGALLPVAEKNGVGLAIENMFHSPGFDHPRFGSTPDDLLALVEALDSARVGICWDTGHANVQRLDQPAALEQLGGRLKALHIADNDGSADQHRIPFTGTIGNPGMCDWAGIVAALKRIGFDGPFNLEIPGDTNRVPLELRPRLLEYACELALYCCKS